MASYGFDILVGNVPYQNHVHIWPTDYPISYPYMVHIISLSLVRVELL